MAEPKMRVIVEKLGEPPRLKVWCDNPRQAKREIAEINGIIEVLSANPIFCYIDPRFSLDELAAEVEALLTTEVPAVFRD